MSILLQFLVREPDYNCHQYHRNSCTLPFCWTFYVSILDEFIYKVPLKSNAEIVDLSYFGPTFSRENKVQRVLSTIFSMTWISAYLLKFPYNNFGTMIISKIRVA